MSRAHTLSAVAVTVAAAALAATSAAPAAPGSHASIVIRHQLHGCHAWAVNGGRFRPSRTLSLRRGGWITVTNDDVMPHRLVETSGPPVRISDLAAPLHDLHHGAHHGEMDHMGAATRVRFTRPGVYRFTTKPGEDYMRGVKTVGPDNVLRLVVTVR